MRESQKRLDTVITNPSDVNESKDEHDPDEPVVIEWRIPQDNQRVMLFEKLEYVITSKEVMDKQLRHDIEHVDIDKSQFDETMIDETHGKELAKFYSLIGDLK